MNVYKTGVFTLICILILQESLCQVYPSREIVNNIIYNGYQKDVRPRCLTDPAVNVVIDVGMRSIIELNAPEQSLLTNAWLRVYWKDCRLTWNATQTGVSSIVITPDIVWTPDITLYDSNDDAGMSAKMSYRIIMNSDGNLRHQIPVVLNSLCQMDTTYFPFDRQSCPLTFGMWSYSGLEVNITNLRDLGDLSSYIEHVEWEVTEVDVVRFETVYGSVPYPTVQFVLELKRKPFYYVINLLFPCILISFVSILGFMLPSDNGDKMNLEMTVLLSLSVYQLIVRDMMPPNSESVPYISIYFASTLSLVGLSCVLNGFILNVFFKGDHGWRVPKLAKSLILGGLGPAVCIKRDKATPEQKLFTVKFLQKPIKNNNFSKSDIDAAEGSSSCTQLSLFQSINERLSSITSHLTEIESENSEDWKLVALVLDRTFMVFHALGSILMAIIFVAKFLDQ